MRKPYRKLKRFGGLEPEVRRCVLLCLLLEPTIRLSLKLGGFRRTMVMVNRISRPGVIHEGPGDVHTIETGFNLAMRQLSSRDGCLSRSIALYALLRAHNHLVKLTVGVQKERDGFTAHAWVELGGVAMAPDGELGASFATLGTVAG